MYVMSSHTQTYHVGTTTITSITVVESIVLLPSFVFYFTFPWWCCKYRVFFKVNKYGKKKEKTIYLIPFLKVFIPCEWAKAKKGTNKKGRKNIYRSCYEFHSFFLFLPFFIQPTKYGHRIKLCEFSYAMKNSYYSTAPHALSPLSPQEHMHFFSLRVGWGVKGMCYENGTR